MAPRGGEPALVNRALFNRIGPTRGSLRRGAAASALAAVPLFALSALNKLRFGSPNPVSYGPCVWRRCGDTGLGAQSAAAMLAYAGPVIAFVLAVVIVAYAARKWRYAPLAVSASGLAVLAWSHGTLHDHASRLAMLAWANFVDTSEIAMPPMVSPGDGLGRFWGPYVVKATLQSTPLFGFVIAVPFSNARERHFAIALALPAFALYALLAMRAVIPETAHALGFPWLHMRYASPAWPLLAVLSVAGLARLPWKRSYVIATVVLAIALTALLALGENDLALPRRFLVLRVSLILAFTGALAAAMNRRRPGEDLARLQVAIACMAFVCGSGFSCGIDFNTMVGARIHADELVDALAKRTPERFALVGYAREIDMPLTLRATRDLEYADLLETTDWTDFRELIDYWVAEDRPIFALMPNDSSMMSPWPDVSFDLVDREHRLLRVTKR
jgi:hypothetical protein